MASTMPTDPPGSPLERALRLLDMRPLPEDAEEQLEALAREAFPEDKFTFERLAEGLFVRRNDNP